MQLGMIGLGRMGANMVRRLLRDGHGFIEIVPRLTAGENPPASTGEGRRLEVGFYADDRASVLRGE